MTFKEWGVNVSDLEEIIMPYGNDVVKKFLDSDRELAYYTTADTVYKIIKNKEIWMRNVTVMNDYSEVRYGLYLVSKCIRGEYGSKLMEFLCDCFGYMACRNLDEEINRFINYNSTSWLYNTYITCFTEHCVSEDNLGRLSMWRAYGRDNGAAIVIKKKGIVDLLKNFNIEYTPVAYLDEMQVETQFKRVIASMMKHKDQIVNAGYEKVKGVLIKALLYAIVAIKHPGFAEEKEWRLFIHGENKMPPSEIESLGGVVQPIKKLKLEFAVEDRAVSINGSGGMIDHIIMGPMDIFYKSNVTHKAFVQLLINEFGYTVEEAESKVVSSGIPYRG